MNCGCVLCVCCVCVCVSSLPNPSVVPCVICQTVCHAIYVVSCSHSPHRPTYPLPVAENCIQLYNDSASSFFSRFLLPVQ